MLLFIRSCLRLAHSFSFSIRDPVPGTALQDGTLEPTKSGGVGGRRIGSRIHDLNRLKFLSLLVPNLALAFHRQQHLGAGIVQQPTMVDIDLLGEELGELRLHLHRFQ